MRKGILSRLSALLYLQIVFISAATAQTQTHIPGPAGSGGFGTNVYALPNGNFVVTDPLWDAPGPIADVGAVYLYNGVTNAVINSLTGSQANDQVGAFGIQILSNGDFVVMSPYWNNGGTAEAGAATLCSASTGCTGTVSNANSLVGTSDLDHVSIGGITALPGGKYVVVSYDWSTDAGAVTFCVATGCTGNVTIANSLYGSSANIDEVGFYQVVVLANGNYVVSSIFWGILDNGAVTLCDGNVGCTGLVSAANSTVGSNIFDNIGTQGVIALPGGDFVVGSANWKNGAFNQAGAVTRCSGTTGCPATISSANSLVGSGAGYFVGSPIALTDGNYVVVSPSWNGSRGAVTWCSGTLPCVGAVSAVNSLTGSAANNQVGSDFVRPLPGGKYLVQSPNWDGAFANVGAATFCPTAAACTNVTVSAANSLIGTTSNDNVGSSAIALSNGDYVVGSPNWNNGGTADVGASTFCNGTTGCIGTVTTANSLIGTTTGDNVGNGGAALTTGKYIVRSPNWDGVFANVGAMTFCNGIGGCAGTTVSAANSLVGSTLNDNIGIGGGSPLPNGGYLVQSGNYDNGPTANAGAMTYGNWNGGTTGIVTGVNSVLGTVTNGGVDQTSSFNTVHNRVIIGRPADNIVTLFAPLAPSAATVSVSGRVVEGGRGIARVRLSFTGSNGETLSALTNGFGYYRLDGLQAGSTYVVAVLSKTHTFASQIIAASEDLPEVNFSAQ